MVTNGTNQGSPVDSTCSILFLSFSNQMDFSQQNPNSSSPPSGLTRDLRAGTLRVFRVIGDVESRFLPTQNVCLLMSIVDWKIWKDKTWLKPKTSASLVGRWIWLGCFEHLIGHLQTSQNIFGPVQTSVKRPAKCMFQKKWQYPSWPLLSPWRNNATWPTTMMTLGPHGESGIPQGLVYYYVPNSLPVDGKNSLVPDILYPWFIDHFTT